MASGIARMMATAQMKVTSTAFHIGIPTPWIRLQEATARYLQEEQRRHHLQEERAVPSVKMRNTPKRLLPIYTESTKAEDGDANRGLLYEWNQFTDLHPERPIFCKKLERKKKKLVVICHNGRFSGESGYLGNREIPDK